LEHQDSENKVLEISQEETAVERFGRVWRLRWSEGDSIHDGINGPMTRIVMQFLYTLLDLVGM
jgi:hypothetical protein